VNSQSRMNTGGELVLDRVVQALKMEKGIRAESLLTCLGALAGYACQVSARDGASVPLIEGPFSVWALIGNAVHELGQPLPGLEEIFATEGRRPRNAPLTYVKETWPQVLPTAQQHCDKPMQLPVVFGIAIQRALARMKDVLSPTLGARLAMECAIAMSQATLPASPPAASSGPATAPLAASTKDARPPSRASGALPADFRFTASAKRREVVDAPRAPSPEAVMKNLPPYQRMVAVVVLALIGVGGALWNDHLKQTEAARREQAERNLRELQRLTREPNEPNSQPLDRPGSEYALQRE
jgi:hypothetical protein